MTVVKAYGKSGVEIAELIAIAGGRQTFSNKANLSLLTIQNVVSGKSVKPSTASIIAKALGKRYEDLFFTQTIANANCK